MFAAVCRLIAFVLRVSFKNESKENELRNVSRSAIREIQSLAALPAALIAALLGLMGIHPAFAQNTFTVTRFDDTAANVTYTNPSDGLGAGVLGDLRFEMLAAMAAGGSNSITFSGCSTASPCTIVLNGPLPPIFEINNPSNFSLTIDGGAEGAVILDGNSGARGTNRVFFVDNVAVILKNLVIQNATAQGGAGGHGNDNGGGGGAGFGAGLMVNQSSARATVENTAFLNCAVVGGAGGQTGGPGGGGGGGLAFAGGNGGGAAGGGGGGVTGYGSSGGGLSSGGNGGNGGGGGGTGQTEGVGGLAYGTNATGAVGSAGNGGAGGFGGGGGGSVVPNGGTGGFGGGGGGGALGGNGGTGGFGGGGGGGNIGSGSAAAVGGIQGGTGNSNGGGGGAAGPAIFVNAGSVTLSNVTGSGFSATPGAGGASATAGTASTAPVFNLAGTVNGSSTVGGLPGALPVGGSNSSTVYGGTPVGQTSAVQTATLWITTTGQPAKLNVLTQGAANLDFQLASGGSCSTATTYQVGQSCTVNFTFAPLHPGLRMGGITLTDGSGNVLASVLISGIGSGPQAAFNGSGTAITTLGGGFNVPHVTAVDASGNVYVADTINKTVYEMPQGCSNSSCLIQLGGGFNGPTGVALDGAGNVYVADEDVLEVMPPGCGSPSCVTSLVELTGAATIAVDGAGNLFSDLLRGAVELPAGCSNDGCVISLTGGHDSLTSGTLLQATVDASGNVYYATESSTIVVLPAGCRSSSCVTTMGGGFGSVAGVALDAGGSVYASDNTNGTVSVVPPGCTSSSCVTLLQSGLTRLGGIALDGNGNLYVSQRVLGTGLSTVKQFALATAPTVNFATSTTDGTTDTTDGTQTVQVFNNGNQPLVFSGLTYSADFPEAGGDSNGCYSSISLSASAECDLPIAFEPVAPSSGVLSESVILTDNSLNASSATQSISIIGTAIAPIIVPSLTPYFANSPTSMPLGGNISFFVLVANPSSTSAIANGTVTISLPAGLQVVAGSLGTTCPGTVTYSPSSSTITHTGIALGKSANCQDGFTLTATALGSQQVSAVASVGANTGSSATASITVADTAASLALIGAPSSAYVGGSFNFTVTAVDPLGNADTAYTGTVAFTSNDKAAGLQSSYTFTAADAGSHLFTATLNTVGKWTITATDSADSLSVTTGNITVSIPNLVVTTAADDAGTAANCTVQAKAGTGTDNACSLRDALLEATALGSANITFDSTAFATAQTITLGSAGTLKVPANVAISGAYSGGGATLTNRVTVSGNNQFGVFNINSGKVSIDGLAITSGNNSGNGGGIDSGATLTLTNCTFNKNHATGSQSQGGAIHVTGPTTVNGCVFTNNQTTLLGGAAFFYGSTSTISNSIFSGNSDTSSYPGSSGGAIFAENGNLTITGNIFSSNSVSGNNGTGGAISNSGTMLITGSVFTGNSTGRYGFAGAIANYGPLTITNSTLTGNTGGTSAGAIGNYATQLTVVGSTITSNSGNGFGDGIDAESGTFTLANSIVSNNGNDIQGNYTNNGGNLVSASGVNLASLGNYGGSTQTMLPLPVSSAICAGTLANAQAASLTTDQRGLPFDPNCPSGTVDSGAVQSNYAISFTTDASSVITNTAMNPAPAVTLSESGNPFLNHVIAIPLTLNGTGALAGGSANTDSSTGIATYAGLSIDTAGTGDSLSANLVLNSVLNPAVAVTVNSSKFNVTVAQVAVPNVVSDTQAAASTAIIGAGLVVGAVTSQNSSTVASGNVISQSPTATTQVNVGSSVNLVVSLGPVQVAVPNVVGDTQTAAIAAFSNVGLTLGTVGKANSNTVPAGEVISQSPSSGSNVNSGSAVDIVVSLGPLTYPLGIAASPSTGGTFTPASGGSYNSASSVNITAAPSAGYYFTGWTGSADIAAPSRASTSITINGAESITANFASIPSFVVTTTSDDASGVPTNCPSASNCSLRDALAAAAALTAANGTIDITFDPTVFATPQTITLGSGGTLNIPTNTTITGPTTGSGATSANLLTLSGAGTYQIFSIGASETGVTINELTMANGYKKGSPGGGAIYANSPLTVTRTSFSADQTTGDGGAINAQFTLTVADSTFFGNSASGNGGAIYAAGGAAGLVVSNTTFSANVSTNSNGGAIASNGGTITNSTFSGNTATGKQLSEGGALLSVGPMKVSNSIFVNNPGSTGSGIISTGPGPNADHNLFYGGDACNGCTTNTNAASGDPMLSALSGYGGPTQTMIPLPGSAAICAGVTESVNSATIVADQRGVTIPTTYGSTQCYDIGAVQTDYALSFTTSPSSTQIAGQSLTPAPVLTLSENNAPFTAANVNLTLKASAGSLSGTATEGTSTAADATAGQATFSGLSISPAETTNTLTSTLALTAAGATTPASVTAQSSSFSVGAPSLAITESDAGTFVQGQTGTDSGNGAFTFVVSNTGSAATGGTLTLVDSLPTGMSLSGSGPTPAWGCVPSGNTVTCRSTQSVAGGSSYPTLTLNVSVAANSALSVTNTAVVYGAGDPVFTSAGNGATASDTVSVKQTPATVTITGGNNQQATVGAAYAAKLSFVVKDAASVVIPSFPVALSAPVTSGASVLFSNNSPSLNTATDSNGAVSVPVTADSIAGAFQVSVTAGTLTSSFSLNNAAIVVPNVVGDTQADAQAAITSAGLTVGTVSTANSLTVPSGSVISQSPSAGAGANLGAAISFVVSSGPPSYLLNIAANDSSFGAFTPTTSGSYTAATVVNLTATPNSGYYFVNWTGSADIASASSPTTTITMNGPESITANFAAIPGFVVTTTADDATGVPANCPSAGNCSLRDAIAAAAALTAANGTIDITFDPTVFSASNTAAQNTITLTTGGPLQVLSNVSITGPANASTGALSNQVTLDGAHINSILSFSQSASASIANLAIVNGKTTADNAGAIYNAGTLSVANTTFAGNSAGLEGGAIFNIGKLTVTNSTFTNNSGSVYGGAIEVNGGTATISSSTFTANSASSWGGGIANSGGKLILANTIVSGNIAPTGPDIYGSYSDNGGNVVASSSLNLSTLGSYGGSTQTMIPLPGSAAICAGTLANATAASLTADQRGFGYSSTYCPSGAVDAGAVQTDYALNFTTSPDNSIANQPLAPAPVVTLTENGAPFTGGAVSVAMSASLGTLGGTSTQTTSIKSDSTAGTASFSGLTIVPAESQDKLTATVALGTSLNIAAVSDPFDVATESLSATCPATNTGAPNVFFSSGPETVTGGIGTLTYFLASGSLPSGLTLNSSTGAVSGTPAYSGVFSVGVKDANNISSVTNCAYSIVASKLLINWPTPTAIVYGTPLSATQLDATANVAGNFTYSPALSTVLTAGVHTLSAIFTPNDTADYKTTTTTVSIQVTKATPDVDWYPAPLLIGTKLTAAQLNATVNVKGKFVYTPALGTAITTSTETLKVVFTPTDTTDFNVVTRRVYLPVSVVTVSPTSIDFGTVYLGSVSTRQFKVTNLGTGTIKVDNSIVSILKNGSPSEFVAENLCSIPLGPHQSCTIQIQFVAGPYYQQKSAILSIHDNSPGSPQQVSMTALTIDPGATLNTTNLNFGAQKVGTLSAAQTIVLTNTGATPLSIAGIVIGVVDPHDFLLANTCGRSLAAGANCKVNVQFKPAAKGPRTANLVIKDNVQKGSQTVSLSGAGS